MTEYKQGDPVPWFDQTGPEGFTPAAIAFACDCTVEETADRVEIRSTGPHRAAFDITGGDRYVLQAQKTLVLMPEVASTPAQVWRP